MATLLTNKYKLRNARKILELFSSSSDSVYCFIGKFRGWTSDPDPDTPGNSFNGEIDIWDEIIYANKVSSNDASLVIPYVLYDTSGATTYDPWDDTDDMSGKNWYVMNSSNQVYKCISNNGGEISDTTPSADTVSGVIHHNGNGEDGYIWKYMYTADNTTKFLSNDIGFKWFPIEHLSLDDSSDQWDIQKNAVHGSVEYIKSTNSNLYEDLTVGHAVTLVGNGEDFAGVVAQHSSLKAGYDNKYINITNSGKNYTKVSKVLVNGSNDDDLRAIISPIGGHGFNASKELNSTSFMVTSEFSDANIDLGTSQQYRQVGLLLNPIVSWGEYDDITSSGSSISSGTRFSGSIAHQLVKIKYDDTVETQITTDFPLDVSIYQGAIDSETAKGNVVRIDTSNKFLYVVTTDGGFVKPTSGVTSTYITNGNNSATLTDTSVLTLENYEGTSSSILYALKRYSGDIIYLDNFTPISRTSSKETVRIVIQF